MREVFLGNQASTSTREPNKDQSVSKDREENSEAANHLLISKLYCFGCHKVPNGANHISLEIKVH